eukprot:2738823-Prymnesium_polylepis.1
MTVVGSTLEAEVVEAEADVLLCLHPPVDYAKSNATVHRLAAVLAPLAPRVRVATMDMLANAFEPHVLPGVAKYATDAQLLLLHATAAGGRKLAKFNGPPSMKALLPWLKKHSAAVRTSWDEVKASLSRVNAAAAAKKAVAAELARQELAEKRRQLVDADEEEVCCDGDRGVLKATLQRGSGAPPAKGSRLRVHYTGRLVVAGAPEAGGKRRAFEGAVFDSSVERGDPFEFAVGAGQVISGWDHGFGSMSVGERALLTLAPAYAYGEVGSPPKIPRNASLEFEVELLGVNDGRGGFKSEL